jgi:acetyl esterase
MKRVGAVAGVIVLVLLVAGAGVLWSWTRTPHGPMDLGAAVLLRTMPSGPMQMTPAARAEANRWVKDLIDGRVDPTVAVREIEFPGPGGPLPMRLYAPPGAGPFPLVVWIHGGGFWMGDQLAIWDGSCSRLAANAGALVASVGYRLAPEHPYPAAIDDSYAGLLYAAEHAPEWNGDPTRIAVMGGSAGGNLSAAVAQRARDTGGPHLAFQVLIVPALNAGGEPTESMRAFRRGFGLDGIDEMHDAYFPDPARAREAWASPLLAADVSGLPPALIVTAQFDPLRDEGEAYAERLRAAGVPATLQRYDGAIHGFLGSPSTQRASEELSAATLRLALQPGS